MVNGRVSALAILLAALAILAFAPDYSPAIDKDRRGYLSKDVHGGSHQVGDTVYAEHDRQPGHGYADRIERGCHCNDT